MRIAVDLRNGTAALRAVEALRQRAANLAPVFAGIGQDAKEEAGLAFRESRDPYGVPWKPLAPSTVAGRRGSGHGVKPLVDTGALRNSIGVAAGPTSVSIGTVLSYAAIHQFGGTIQYEPRQFTVRLRTVTAERKDGTTYRATRFASAKHKRVTLVEAAAPARSVTIPARPYLPTQERGLPIELAESIRDRLANHFRGVAL